jgi:hypothetical protein
MSLSAHSGPGPPWASDQPVTRPLPIHRTTHTHQTSMYWVGFEPTIRAREDSSCLRPLGYCDRLASEREETIHALDRAATVIVYLIFRRRNKRRTRSAESWGRRHAYKIFIRKHEGRSNLHDLGVHGNVILNKTVSEWRDFEDLDWIHLRQGSKEYRDVVGMAINEHSGFVESGEFLD